MDKIIIDGHKFSPVKSTEEIGAGAAAILRNALMLDVFDESKILEFLKDTASKIDSWFGCQAVLEISDGKPVSVPFALKIVNATVEQLSEIYNKYVLEEYGENE